MKYLHIFVFFIHTILILEINSMPVSLPSGQILYRVSSEYFKQPESHNKESSNSLYNLLTQIHYGGTSQSVTISTSETQNEDISNDNMEVPKGEASTQKSTNEYPKAVDDVTELQQQMDITKINDDNSLQAVIEKVVNEEIKKLSEMKLQTEKTSSVSDEKIPIDTTTEFPSEEESIENGLTTEKSLDDMELSSPTEKPREAENEVEKIETITDENMEIFKTESQTAVDELETTTMIAQDMLQPEEIVNIDNSINESLLNAVGDLLSSILGLESKKTYEVENENVLKDKEADVVSFTASNSDEDVISKEPISQNNSSESLTTNNSLDLETSSEATEIEHNIEEIDKNASLANHADDKRTDIDSNRVVPAGLSPVVSNDFQDKELSEIDLKIENLANAQPFYATENIPEQFIEAVNVENIKTESEPLEASEIDVVSPISFDEKINQVMNLVKSSDGRLSLQSVGNVVDSILIDKHMKDDVNNLDQIVYGTLKNIEENLGLNEDSLTSADSYDPMVHHREDLIKSFETEINESLFNKAELEQENYMPNSAKAAIYFKNHDIDF
ncbi:CLUMA_CG009134, isoform A [Clunio marinus]|uniref:CLUMA_CG009134, isoform A n=1 Tax=Clunio marinus TaxID=568069 RepID=A0A1J1I7X1_9DIPT|nr:CLUMA_CG009134, isoform A [Clunio marinus]